MEEVEKYQQRLQAIVERRWQLAEEERLKRETEEERLNLVQKKRKTLRDQWFSEPAPVHVLPSFATQDTPDRRTAWLQSKSQQTPEEEEEQEADVTKATNEARRVKNTDSVVCTVSVDRSKQDSIEKEVLNQVSGAAQGHIPVDMAQRIFHEGVQDGRSVLGMVAVQVERDAKTGATVIRSVAPVSAPSGGGVATTVFDDGRKRVHAVGAPGAQPSAQELEQVLSAIDGVGMKVLLDEVTVTPEGETRFYRTLEEKEGKVLLKTESISAPSQDNGGPLHVVGVAEGQLEGSAATLREVPGGEDDVDKLLMGHKMEEGPVTLTFLGYADTDSDQGGGQGFGLGREDGGEVLTVERVIITDDGEEKPLEQAGSCLGDSAASAGGNGANVGANEKGHQEGAFQDIPLEGSGAEESVQGEKTNKGPQESVPSTRQEDGASKPKTCRCCSVM